MQDVQNFKKLVDTQIVRNFGAQITITIGNIVYDTGAPAPAKYRLIDMGRQLAFMLAEVLQQLKAYDESEIYPIMEILEPFTVTTSGMDFSFPPKSSRTVTVEVTRRGKIEPVIYFDE